MVQDVEKSRAVLWRDEGSFEDLPAVGELAEHVPWYLRVATNEMPAKYLIARRTPVDLDGVALGEAREEELWAAHEAATEAFGDRRQAIRSGRTTVEDLEEPEASLVDLSVELVSRTLRDCTFCRWRCEVDRGSDGKRGTCQLGTASRVGSFFHHRGEERIYKGTEGSGTVFFTSCNLRCGFCQNGDISEDKDNGLRMTPRHVALAAWKLRMEGCHNVNFVGGEPTVHLHTVVEAIAQLDWMQPDREELNWIGRVNGDPHGAGGRGDFERSNAEHRGLFNVPVLWNSNFFMSEEAMRLLRPLVDVWLPDLKFGNDDCAVRLSKTPWYWETTTRNVEMVHEWGEDLSVRHLVMPNHVDCCTEPVLDWLADHAPEVPVNVMDQYYPDCHADRDGPKEFNPDLEDIARYPTAREIRRAYEAAEDRGLAWRELSLEEAA